MLIGKHIYLLSLCVIASVMSDLIIVIFWTTITTITTTITTTTITTTTTTTTTTIFGPTIKYFPLTYA
jgi:hypothetical protein